MTNKCKIVLLILFSLFQQNNSEISILKPFLHSKTEQKLTGYLNELSVSVVPLSNSIWKQLSRIENEECKICPIHPNLAKMIRIEDGCLDNAMSNQSEAFYGLSKAQELGNLQLQDKYYMICLLSGHIEAAKTELETNDCYFGTGKMIQPKNEDLVEVLVLSWVKDVDKQCPPKAKRVKTLYETLKMKDDHDFFMIHAIDKYLSANKGYNLDEFIEELKTDPTMTNPTLPEWDSECSDIAGELFDILDTNDDKVLNQKDLNPLLTKRNSKLIANKVKDLDETAFDMKIRVAGPIDFTLPNEDVESMIMALTRRDLGFWQQKQDNDENVNQKDEL